MISSRLEESLKEAVEDLEPTEQKFDSQTYEWAKRNVAEISDRLSQETLQALECVPTVLGSFSRDGGFTFSIKWFSMLGNVYYRIRQNGDVAVHQFDQAGAFVSDGLIPQALRGQLCATEGRTLAGRPQPF